MGVRSYRAALWRFRSQIVAYFTSAVVPRDRARLPNQSLCILYRHQFGNADQTRRFDGEVGAISNWRDNALFEPQECLALEYAEAMTLPGQGVDEKLRARLKQQWDDETIIELTGLIAFQNLSSKFNAALDVPTQGFCVLPNHPLQTSDHDD
jgi:alkylhydroperoxidase family enzyme